MNEIFFILLIIIIVVGSAYADYIKNKLKR